MENAVPGALYTDTCPCHTTGECSKCRDCKKCFEIDEECRDCKECFEIDEERGDCKKCLEIEKQCENVKVFEIALVQAKLTYNQYGWHDPEGRFFVLKEELERFGGLESYIRMVEE